MTSPDLSVNPYRRIYRLSADGTRWQSNGVPDILTVQPTVKRAAIARVRMRAIAPPAGSTRDDLVIGTYKPDLTNTGIDLSVVSYAGLPQEFGTNGVKTYSALNTESNRVTIPPTRFRCNITITGSAYTFKNCVFEGDPIRGGQLITCNSANVRAIEFIDCDFSPSTVWSNTSGIFGKQFMIKRCNIEHLIDCFAIINQNANAANYLPSVDMGVQIYQSYVHDLAMCSPDPGAAGGFIDNSGHVDVLQIRGGSNYHMRGNNIQLFVTTDRGVGDHFNATFELANNYHVTGNKYPNDPVPNAGVAIWMYSPYLGDTNNFVMEDNYIDGGSYMININNANTTSSGIIIRNNKLGPIGQRTGWGKFIIAKNTLPMTVVGNTKEADGTPYNVRTSG
jgi:hypothetical protein